MHICLCLRGIHYRNDTKLNVDYRKSFENYKENLIIPLEKKGYKVDIILFTYDSEIKENLINDYNPFYYEILPFNEMFVNTSWNRQIIFHRKTLETIKKIQFENNFSYDYIINTRFDLKFNIEITNMNIDLCKFNIAFKHSSGNCDDNFWIFTNLYLNQLDKALENLYQRNAITHEINRYFNNDQINYMHQGDYLYWSFLRIQN